ncbi:MAG TPA: hypothetical protein VI603_06095 [Saprospiraceae bacterium]|nr:hypothetical protein [Saprospiraceae bacterium]
MSRLLLLLLSMMISLIEVRGEKFEGYVVMLSGDTIACRVLFNDLATYSTSDEIISKSSIKVLIKGETLRFRPDEIKCYAIKVEGGVWQTYFGVNIGKDDYMYMRLETEGKMSLFSCVTYSNLTMRYSKHYLFVNNSTQERLHLIDGIFTSLRQHYSFFDNCRALIDKLEEKDINLNRSADWNLVAVVYNEQC